MADVSITELSDLSPTGPLYVPISNGSTTGKAQLSALQVDYNSLTNKPSIPLNAGMRGIQIFETSGTFTVPADTTRIEAHLVGGGGGGGARFNRGVAGTASSITGYDIVANGGRGNGDNVPGIGGTCTGALVSLSINGNDTGYNAGNQDNSWIMAGSNTDGRGWYQYGGQGHRPLGFKYYGGGGIGTPGNPGGNTGWAGAGGGYAMGFLTVTPGQVLTINVGTGGASGGTSGSGPGKNGVVILRW